jgi:hypothetical protein
MVDLGSSRSAGLVPSTFDDKARMQLLSCVWPNNKFARDAMSFLDEQRRFLILGLAHCLTILFCLMDVAEIAPDNVVREYLDHVFQSRQRESPDANATVQQV